MNKSIQKLLLSLAISSMLLGCATTKSGRIYYMVTVQEGETLDSLAEKFDCEATDIAEINSITTGLVSVGQKLKIYPGSDAEILRRDRMMGKSPVPGNHLNSEEDLTMSSNLSWPVRGQISSTFGRRGWRQHTGIDIRGPKGTPITSAADGVVTFAGWRRGYGNTVEIRHDALSQSTVYAHCLKFMVRVGQTVKNGQLIGQVGRSGNATGYHLHFEVLSSNKTQVDPLRYLASPNQQISALP